MNEGDDLDRLRRKLGRLAAAPVALGPEGRLLGRAPDLLAALLTEVDETIQGRRLTFVTDQGDELVGDAYGGRLLSLSGLPGWERRALDDAHFADLRVALEGWLRGAAQLSVRSAALPNVRDPAEFGISATALAAAWGLMLEPSAQAPFAPLDALLARFDGRAQAWLRVRQSAAHAWGGPSEAVALLTRLAAEALPGIRTAALTAEDDTRRCIILGSEAEETAVTLALDGAEALVLKIALADLAEVNRIWRRATGA
jgi:hypothetical protein